jgi:beta-glucosidase-like glycosyl hydrolase
MRSPLSSQLFYSLTVFFSTSADPRWGRGQETPGEDPTVNGAYAAAFVAGLQGDRAANGGFLRTSACLKHLAAYRS